MGVKQFGVKTFLLYTLLGLWSVILLSVDLPASLAQDPLRQNTESQCTGEKIEYHIQQLADGSPEAFEALVGCRSKAVPSLIKALRSQDENLLISAISILGQIGSPASAAVPGLEKKLTDNYSFDVQAITVHSLGSIGKNAVPALLRASGYSRRRLRRSHYRFDEAIRFRARIAIKKIGKAVIPALIIALKDPDDNVRTAAIDALYDFGEDATPALIKTLKNTDSQIHISAINILGQMGMDAKAAIPALIAALKDPNDSTRVAAAKTFGRMGADAKAAIPALTTALNDSSANVRAESVEALGEIGGKDAIYLVKPLIHMLKDIDDEVRCNAANNLGIIGASAQDAVPDLVTSLKASNNNSIHDKAFICIAKALGEIGLRASDAKQVIFTLTPLLKDDQADYYGYIDILAKIGKGNISALMEQLKTVDKKTRIFIFNVLQRMGSSAKEAISTLINMSQDSDSEVRAEAIETLSAIGIYQEDVISTLLLALKDPSPNVRSNAVRSLGGIVRANRHKEKYISFLITALDDPDTHVVDTAIFMLDSLDSLDGFNTKDRFTYSALIRVLQRRYSEGNFKAAIVLARLGDKTAISILIDNLSTYDPSGCDNDYFAISVKALEKSGQKAVPQLVAALKNLSKGIKLGSTRILATIQANIRDAIPELSRIFLDEYEFPEIRYEAMKALKRAGDPQATIVLEQNLALVKPLLKERGFRFGLMVCTASKSFGVRVAATTFTANRPPVMCRIQLIRDLLRWKCP